MPGSGYPIAESLPEPVFVFDEEKLSLKWMNVAAEAWLQRPLGLYEGVSASQLNRGFSVAEAKFAGVLETKASYGGLELAVRCQGRDYICSYQVFYSSAGVVLHINPKEEGVGLGDTRPDSQAVTMLGKMLAHELKNPLAGIRGAAQLLESELPSEDDRELTDLIKTEVDRIGRIVEGMESFASGDSAKIIAINIHETLRKAKLLFQADANLGVLIFEDYDPSLPDVLADEDGLMQVIVNLLANARDAIKGSGEGREIRIKTGFRAGVRKRLESGEIVSLPIEIKVKDDGPGIPRKLRERIFQPFVTGKPNGQGLGLALTSKIIDDHNGLIEVHSEPGKTVFTILLPAAP